MFPRLLTAALVCHVMAGAAAGDKSTTRIVSLVPAATNLLFATGAVDQVAGISDFCQVPPGMAVPPRLGGLLNPNVEKIVLTRPDTVLLFKTQTETARQLSDLHVGSELLKVDTLEELRETGLRLARYTGLSTPTTTLFAEIDAELDLISSRSDGLRRVKTLIVVSRRPGALADIYQNTPEMFLSRLAELAGAVPALHAGARITPEAIIRANPELIIDMSIGEIDPHSVNPAPALVPWRALSTVTAVKESLVIPITDPQALVIGDHITTTARQIEQIVVRARQQLIK